MSVEKLISYKSAKIRMCQDVLLKCPQSVDHKHRIIEQLLRCITPEASTQFRRRMRPPSPRLWKLEVDIGCSWCEYEYNPSCLGLKEEKKVSFAEKLVKDRWPYTMYFGGRPHTLRWLVLDYVSPVDAGHPYVWWNPTYLLAPRC